MRYLIFAAGLACVVLANVLPSPAAAAGCPVGPLSLTAAQSLATRDNPQIVLARDSLAAAAAGQRIASERPNPSLTAGVSQWDSRARMRGAGLYQQPAYSYVQLQQLVERGGKRAARQEAAQASADAADADLADVSRRVGDAVREGYYDLKLAIARAQALQAIDELQQRTLAAADRRLKAGDIAQADRARIALEAYKAANERQQAQADAQAAQLAFGGLLGCRASADLDPADDWPQSDAPPAGAGPRADEVADQQRLRAAEAALRLAQAQTHRDLTLGVEWDHDPREAPNMVGITISVPLFLAHRYEGEIAQARAQLDGARTVAAQTALQADVERDSAVLLLAATARKRERAVDRVLPQAESAAAAVEYAYAHGAAPLLDLLDARRALRAARLDALAAQSDFAKALAARDAALTPYRRSTP